MAEPVSEILVDAVLELIERSNPQAQALLSDFLTWLGDVGQPPPGLEFIAADGAQYTGVAFVLEGEVALLFAVARPGDPIQARPAAAHSGRRIQRPTMFVDSLYPLGEGDDFDEQR